MFYSTRNKNLKVKASEAIIKGISDEGGLFLPYEFPKLDVKDVLTLSYQDLAATILSKYLDDFELSEIKEAVSKAYCKDNFAEKVIGITTMDSFSYLELFHGPTITFKDMALSLLPHLMEIAKKKNNIDKKIMILTATSGDTGSAALSNFSKCKDIGITVLYPDKGISVIQEKQMLYFTSKTSRAYAIDNSNFDDCQTLVKKILNIKQDKIMLSSANSINIGRLLPQIVYYYKAYIDLVNNGTIRLNDKLDVIVPTGNFGNIFASYLAKKMGCPLGKIICASNENRVLTDFFETGKYTLDRTFIKTNSPSMDILISSNLERLLSLLTNDDKKVTQYMNDLKEKKYFEVDEDVKEELKNFGAFSIDQNQTLEMIKEVFDKYDYLMDPHTAVSYGAYKDYKKTNPKNHVLVVSTASPFKFPETILSCFGEEEVDAKIALDKIVNITGKQIPQQLQKIIAHQIPAFHLQKDEVEARIFRSPSLSIKVPGSSANLGPGFDVCGVALDIFNTFKFTPSEVDELIGFRTEDCKNNLVLNSYKYLFKNAGKEYIPVKIEVISTDVPESRGLGSSSTCIIAGLLAANEILNRPLSKNEVLKLACDIEGHPDNVAPCLLGGMVSSYKKNKEFISTEFEVNKNLRFILCIPEYKLSTKEARRVLPKEMTYNNVIFNTSRIILLPSALKEGNITLLKDIIEDKMHTPYRLQLIPDSDKIKNIADKYGLPFTISGAGSSLLIISDNDEVIEALEKENYKIKFRFVELSVNHSGAIIKEA